MSEQGVKSNQGDSAKCQTCDGTGTRTLYAIFGTKLTGLPCSACKGTEESR